MKIIENDNKDSDNSSDNDDKNNNASDNYVNNDNDKIPVNSPHKGPIMLNFDVTFVESSFQSYLTDESSIFSTHFIIDICFRGAFHSFFQSVSCA